MAKVTVAEQLTPWPFIEAGIDWDRVSAAVGDLSEQGSRSYSFEQTDAREIVYLTAQRWLPLDLLNLKVSHVEQEHDDALVPEFPGLLQKSIIDIEGELLGFSTAFKPYAGQKFIIDWKTSGGGLDTKWSNDLKDSWQWRIYAAQRDVQVILYRGLSRTKVFREVPIVVPFGNTALVHMHLKGIYSQIDALKDFPMWPKHRPSACFSYGMDCEYSGPCGEEEGPFGGIDFTRPISYSGSERFLSCPEKFRRSRLAGAERGGSEATEFGSAVHRGMAEIYRQVYKL